MFIADLFEAKIQKVLVIMPGGFHPFHTGHLSLYSSAVKAFPGADVYVAATNDTKARPFPFEIKQELATIAGVPEGHFVQVKSPFQAREITSQYDPETTALVFVRSEKDRNEPPQAGGVKKNGEPSYLQPYTGKNLLPMSQRGYMAYLPTVQFAGGVTSATQIRDAWAKGNAKAHAQIAKTLYPRDPQRAEQLLATAMSESIGEADDRDFVSFMNKSLGDRVDAPKASNNNAPDWYKNAPVHDIDSVKGGWGKALRWGLGVLKRLSPDQKIKLASRGEDGVTDWLVDLAIKKGLAMDYDIPDQDHTQFQFAQEDVTECQDYLADVFHDPNITSWLDVIQQNESVQEDAKGRDIKRIPLIQKARIAHPMAHSDEEALALYVNDREEADVNRLDREQHREMGMINKIDNVEHDLENKIANITQELNALKKKVKVRNEDASGVIATKAQAKDPRYSMSLTKDVRPGQIDKNLRAFNLK